MICPWDYRDHKDAEESDSAWSDSSIEMDSTLKRPGGNLLRSYQNRDITLEFEEEMVVTFKLHRLEPKSIVHLLSAVKRYDNSMIS